MRGACADSCAVDCGAEAWNVLVNPAWMTVAAWSLCRVLLFRDTAQLEAFAGRLAAAAEAFEAGCSKRRSGRFMRMRCGQW